MYARGRHALGKCSVPQLRRTHALRYAAAMPPLVLTLLRVDRDESPTVIEALFHVVHWPFLPRVGEGVEILEDFEAQTVESVGYGVDGSPLVHLGRVVLDDLQVQQLRHTGWVSEPLPGAPAR